MGPCRRLQIRSVRDRVGRPSEDRLDPERHKGRQSALSTDHLTQQSALTRLVQASYRQAP